MQSTTNSYSFTNKSIISINVFRNLSSHLGNSRLQVRANRLLNGCRNTDTLDR